MKLSEIVADLKGLKDLCASFTKDKATATDASLASFSAKLTALETGALAELATKTTELASAQTANSELTSKITAYNSELTAVNTALKGACAALKLEVKEGATNVEMVSAIQAGVTATLARLQVDPSKVPAGVPTTGAGTSVKKKSLDEEIKERQAATATK